MRSPYLLFVLRLFVHAPFARPSSPLMPRSKILMPHTSCRLSTHLSTPDENQIIGSMKRDFLASGRQPAGVCCAALTLATRVNRIERSKEEIRKVCECVMRALDARVCVPCTWVSWCIRAQQGATVKNIDMLVDFRNEVVSDLTERTRLSGPFHFSVFVFSHLRCPGRLLFLRFGSLGGAGGEGLRRHGPQTPPRVRGDADLPAHRRGAQQAAADRGLSRGRGSRRSSPRPRRMWRRRGGRQRATCTRCRRERGRGRGGRWGGFRAGQRRADGPACVHRKPVRCGGVGRWGGRRRGCRASNLYPRRA